jgi:small GTP-binding protein
MSQSAKAVLVGDTAVGKTALYTRLDSHSFDPRHIPTVGGSFTTLTVSFEGFAREVGLWDTAGQEKFRTIVPLYFQRADIVVLCFDLTSMPSFDSIEMWYELAKAHAPPTVHFLLIGTKSDLIDERQVQFPDAQQKSERLHADVYIETSAATSAGLDQLISAFGRCLANRSREEDDDRSTDLSGVELPANDLHGPAWIGAQVNALRQKCC